MIGRFNENTIYNEDCYKAIKDIPSGSIDLVYIDIPYLYTSANNKKKTIEEIKTEFSTLSKRMARKENSLKNIKIDSGIDYAILDELCRIEKHIYIYMVQ